VFCLSRGPIDKEAGGPSQFTKDPPAMDRIVRPYVQKMDRIRRISTGCMKLEVTGSTLSQTDSQVHHLSPLCRINNHNALNISYLIFVKVPVLAVASFSPSDKYYLYFI